MATYYVRPDGNNANTGLGATAALAWATLTKAAQTCVNGDIIIIAPGTYREIVSPTNDGLTFRGNPSASAFSGVNRGKVIISGRDVSSAVMSRDYGVSATKLITLEDINIVDVRICGVSHAGNLTMRRVKINAAQTAIYSGTALSFTAFDCELMGGNFAIETVGDADLTRCALKGGTSAISITGTTRTLNMYYCLVNGGVNAPFGLYIIAKGCVFERGFLYSTVNTILLVNNGGYTLDGCVFRNSMYALYQSGSASGSPMLIRNCRFENLERALSFGSGGTYTILRCLFINCWAAGNFQNANRTFSYCKFINVKYVVNQGAITTTFDYCTFDGYGWLNSGGAVANNNPTYVYDGSTDGVAYVSTVSPISNVKSLRLEGYEYSPVFIQWIPCEAGKAKTIKLKLKRNTANASYRPEFYFGDQSVIAVNNTAVQTITLTYTHHTTELVPLWICGKVDTSGTDFILIDDIAA